MNASSWSPFPPRRRSAKECSKSGIKRRSKTTSPAPFSSSFPYLLQSGCFRLQLFSLANLTPAPSRLFVTATEPELGQLSVPYLSALDILAVYLAIIIAASSRTTCLPHKHSNRPPRHLSLLLCQGSHPITHLSFTPPHIAAWPSRRLNLDQVPTRLLFRH